ncbi:MAG: class I SAM-dependent rRNA methyltransferase [Bacteroidales bacterium]|nr:class I SAM-dependent rRNA methyltransferase [Bacteroidales bacterium]
MTMTKIILRRGREESLLRFHPWVFSGAVAQIVGKPAEGDVVAVHAFDGSYLASGHYQIGSIAVRILSFDEDVNAPDFWENMLRRALNVRITAGLASDPSKTAGTTDAEQPLTNCFRLVHGEGDNLPGLVIDWYDGVCVLQAHSAGMHRSRKQICSALQNIFGSSLKAVYDKSSTTAPFKAGLELIDGYLYKADGFDATGYTVLENGHRFYVDWEQGQKTGFFLDQRESRELVGRLSKGRNVLNLFCYTGGFSVYALAGGAKSVVSLDSSAKAMEMVDRNVALNGFETCQDSVPAAGNDAFPLHTSICDDAIDWLKTLEADRFNLAIVDPPAFAKHRDALKTALKAYQRLNAAVISKIASGGLVFTYSCSQVVDKEAFALAVFSAAAQTHRSVRILQRFNQPADHAVNIYHPEGEYLKGLLLYVE